MHVISVYTQVTAVCKGNVWHEVKLKFH